MTSTAVSLAGSPTAAPSTPPVLRARIAADVDAPDRVAFDLTLRQLAVLAACGALALGVWTAMTPWTPIPVRAASMVPLAGVGLALAAGRRDGLALDAWLMAAGLFRRRPSRLTPTPAEPLPEWMKTLVPGVGAASAGPGGGPGRPPGLLRLPAEAVDADGTVRHGDAATVLVASTTINITLRTPGEQAGLVAGLGRWLNGLTTPVQVVVSTRRVDLPALATRLVERARGLDGRLAAAAADHAEFLLDLAEDRDPLARTVTIAATAAGGPAPEVAARRAAEHTVTSLTALGAQATILDGATATAVLTAATDPYQAGDDGWSRTPPDAVITPSRRHRPATEVQ
jgi:hypothetical protein